MVCIQPFQGMNVLATLAQLVEQLPRKEQVSGSIPLGGSDSESNSKNLNRRLVLLTQNNQQGAF